MLLVFPFILLFTTILPRKSGKKAALFLLKIWANAFSILSGIWIRVRYITPINHSTPHIYTSNHSSFLDAVAVAASLKQTFSPLGKIEMTKVPIFGSIYSRVVVLINRNDKESREKSVKLLKEEIAHGTSILIFPEGTMNRTNQLLADFYDGAFRIAIETQTPILPFVVKNSKNLLPAADIFKIRPGIIEVIYGTEIPVNGLTLENLEVLKATVKSEMYNMLVNN